MAIELIHSQTPAATAAQVLQQTVEVHEATPILLLVSGGSWLSVLDLLPAQLCSLQLTLGVLDERYDTNPAHNNFSQLTRTIFFATAEACGVDVIDTRVQPGESAEQLANRFEDTVRAWQSDHPDGKIIVTLGMGTDGHTAGIMPGYTAAVSSSSQAYVHSYQVPKTVNPFPVRVTTTPHFLTTQVDAAVAYVAGPEKCTILDSVLQQTVTMDDAPALIWHEMSDVLLVTDCR